MQNLNQIETIIKTLNPSLTFDEMVEAVNKITPITDDEMFELSEDSMLIQSFIDSCGV